MRLKVFLGVRQVCSSFLVLQLLLLSLENNLLFTLLSPPFRQFALNVRARQERVGVGNTPRAGV